MRITFFVSEAARLTGFPSAVMLNHLEQTGVFRRELYEAPHHGKRRKYTVRDLIILKSINKMFELGARPKRIMEAIKTFEKIVELPDDTDGLLHFSRMSAFFIITQEKVIFCENAESLVDLASGGQLAFSFMIGTRQSIAPLAGAVVEFAQAIKRGKPRGILRRIASAHAL